MGWGAHIIHTLQMRRLMEEGGHGIQIQEFATTDTAHTELAGEVQGGHDLRTGSTWLPEVYAVSYCFICIWLNILSMFFL